jgi:hypothetical protein
MSHGELLEMCCLIKRSFLATLGRVDVCLGWLAEVAPPSGPRRHNAWRELLYSTMIANNYQQGFIYIFLYLWLVGLGLGNYVQSAFRRYLLERNQCEASSRGAESPHGLTSPRISQPCSQATFFKRFQTCRKQEQQQPHYAIELSASGDISLLSSSGQALQLDIVDLYRYSRGGQLGETTAVSRAVNDRKLQWQIEQPHRSWFGY